MKRNWNMEDVSDGKLYIEKDMVKIGCNDCEGCSKCCQEMGESIVLDPYDINMMSNNLEKNFEEMLTDVIELGVVDGMILPHIKMNNNEKKCNFLDGNGRCRIHSFRREYADFFRLEEFMRTMITNILIRFMSAQNQKAKVKISKWIDVPMINTYHKFISDWHFFCKKIGEITDNMQDREQAKTINMYILNMFYIVPYNANSDFYKQFYDRLEKIKAVIS